VIVEINYKSVCLVNQIGTMFARKKEPFQYLYRRMKIFSNWYTVELMYAGLRKTDGEVKTWNGLKILIRNKSDLCAIDEVYIKKVYNQSQVRVPYNGVVLDVGAHIGAFSLYAAKEYKAKKVYSFEPCPENYATLQTNVQNNHLSDIITTIPKAIGEQTGTRELFLDALGTVGHSFYSSSQQSNMVKVDCVTLKKALEQNKIVHIDCLKMDCEGAEWEILKTIDEVTLSKIGLICMEYHLKPRDDFIKLLKQLGFSILNSEEEQQINSHILIAKHLFSLV
jgi:FkbM family methyltransferase